MEIRNSILISVSQNDVINGTFTIPDDVQTISSFAFKDINVKKIILGKKVNQLDKYSFSGSNVNEIVLNNRIINIPDKCFFNCKNLKKINLNDKIYTIGKCAFYGCSSLEDIYIGHDLTTIGDDAFAKSGIKKFKTLHKEFRVDTPCNFFSPDGLVLIDKYFNVVSFANGSDLEEYNLANYTEKIINGTSAILPIYSIKNGAFKGSKLHKLIIPSSIKDIGYSSFDDSSIDTLEIHGIDLFSSAYLQVGDNGNYLYAKDVNLPFKNLIFSGNLSEVRVSCPNEFSDVENIIFDNSLKHLNVLNFSFYNGFKKVKEIKIPYGVKSFNSSAFEQDILYKLEEGTEINGKIVISTDTCGEYIYRTITKLDGENTSYRIYKYKDNLSNESLINVRILNKKDLNFKSSNSIFDYENPSFNQVYKYADTLDLFEHYNIQIPTLLNGVFISLVSHNDKKEFIEYIMKNGSDYIINFLNHLDIFETINEKSQSILEKDFNKFIKYIDLLNKYNIDNEIFYNSSLIANIDIDELEYLIINHYDSFIKITTRILNNNIDFEQVYNDKFDGIIDLIFKGKKISKFIDKLNMYGIKDRFLFDANIIMISDNPLFDEILKYYDGNMKRLLFYSNTMTSYSHNSDYHNTEDLLTMMKVCGCFNPDSVRRQKNQTFIIEKVFNPDNSNLDNSISYLRIIGNDIHSIFNFKPFDEDDNEFEDFFRENYLRLLSLETSKSGYIKRIYTNFRNISKSSSSNHGEQRHLKVTLEKCISFLTTNKFSNVPKSYLKLAELVGEYFDDQKYLDYAIKYIEESKKAPRNIFISPTYEDDNIIYDNDPQHDLKGKVNELFSYEWLPKQNIENLLLGKYCNCCAHIAGAGTGIMRASMISDSHQNLVIRNSIGEIVAKATIYVNKEKGYAVFNTIEASFKIRSDEYSYPLYETFMEGCNAFVDEYNKNYTIPITAVSVGVKRNFIDDCFANNNHPIIDSFATIPYSKYKDDESGYGNYNGDSAKQRLVKKL